jgi:glycosyltransferase involved in cell wall biosynthesis
MKNTSSIELSVLLPAYNEALVIDETYKRVLKVCDEIGVPYEIIVVDDGSTDETWSRLEDISKNDGNLVAVKLSRNHGHQLALSAGLNFTNGNFILIMDADLQDPPELLPQMITKMRSGAEVVYAQRASRLGDPILKRIFCALYYRLLKKLTDIYIPLDTGDFRLISRRVRDIIVAMPERQRFIRGMVSWVGFKQESIIYDRDARFAGETKYPVSKLVSLAIDGIISSSMKPLAIALPIGFIAVFSSAIFAGYVILSWLAAGHPPQGWTSLLLAIVFLGGIQLLVLGILGEYIGRVFEQTRSRPMFLVDQIIKNETNQLWVNKNEN